MLGEQEEQISQKEKEIIALKERKNKYKKETTDLRVSLRGLLQALNKVNPQHGVIQTHNDIEMVYKELVDQRNSLVSETK